MLTAACAVVCSINSQPECCGLCFRTRDLLCVGFPCCSVAWLLARYSRLHLLVVWRLCTLHWGGGVGGVGVGISMKTINVENVAAVYHFYNQRCLSVAGLFWSSEMNAHSVSPWDRSSWKSNGPFWSLSHTEVVKANLTLFSSFDPE